VYDFTPDPDENIQQLLALGRNLTVDEVERAMTNCDRNHSPRIVFWLFALKRLSVDVAAHVVPSAWSIAERPQHCLSQADWREMFEFTGYTIDGQRAARPTEPLVLFRGSAKAHRRRWSWTSDQLIAEWFATRSARFGNDTEGNFLWCAEVPPEHLYAEIGEAGRREFEYVVDTRGLKIEPLEPSAVAAAADRLDEVTEASEPVGMVASTNPATHGHRVPYVPGDAH
jgi:hypothetical protein